MILVTRLNGEQYFINAELIRFVEETPNTVITMQDNIKLIVRERADLVVERFMAYQRSVRSAESLTKDEA
ncbi:MAG TPA: flagellar FlbD family protein [Anaerolineaceae bacterium]|nr:flagellar FlbD family protein [Anaerolineaceae bacterium]